MPPAGKKMGDGARIVAIIPARMSSARFPGKPLAPILGLPMIEHVRRRVSLARSVEAVLVATCDPEIAEVVQSSGGAAVLTSAVHERCTDRVAEAASSLACEVVVNIQGDEPCVRPEMIEAVVQPLLEDPTLPCANLMAPIATEEEFGSTDVVKVVINLRNEALYFSREPVPSWRKATGNEYARYKQLGIVAFRSDFLRTFAALPPTPLEVVESVDMLRAVEHGYVVRMVPCDGPMLGVDRPADAARAEALLREDPILARYWEVGTGHR